MTRVDEWGKPVSLDAAARGRLGRALDRNEVIAAYLFGSQARGTSGPLSDVDVAVWLRPELDRGKRFRLQLRLMSAGAGAIGSDEVQVVVLNDASPLLRHRALRDSVLLVDRDPRLRVRLEARTLIEYLDTAPLRAERARSLRARLREGTFGRS